MPESTPASVIRRVKGEVDDVVIEDVSMFRLERMDRSVWWAACYRGDKRISFWFRYDRKKGITVSTMEEGIECVDDT